jgi:hypothetical protein
MRIIRTIQDKRSVVTLATKYSGETGNGEFILPEDFSTLSLEELSALQEQAIAHFDDAYGDGSGLTGETVEALSALTGAIEAITAEVESRATAEQAVNDKAAELAERVHGPATPVVPEGDAAPVENEAAVDALIENINESESVTASAKLARTVIKLPQGARNRQVNSAIENSMAEKRDMKTVVFAKGEGLGVPVGTGLDFAGLGRALDTKLATFNSTQYGNASAMGRQLRELGSFASIHRQIPGDLIVQSNDPDHVDRVIARATAEKNLKGGSLVASGGWNAPSEVLYNEYLELESRDGILSLPEIGVARGGVSITQGPSFHSIYSAIEGFHYTEAQDAGGTYAVDANRQGTGTAGVKPVYHVAGPAFIDHRLEVDGLIIQSGLLGARGYPEHLARVIRGALIAHDHRINADVITKMAAGSTAVTLPAGQLGTAAPVLSAIELQVEHYRTYSRMARTATIEAVFPYWIRGAIRSDLSRRLGVDFMNVPDALISQWFTARGVAPQFVYDWQSIDLTAIASFNQWPITVSFLLYSAGTWIKGISDILTLDTLYDSVLLGNNDFTALFTEEGWFVAQAGIDSRLVTTSISSTGATHIGDEILNDGAII